MWDKKRRRWKQKSKRQETNLFSVFSARGRIREPRAAIRTKTSELAIERAGPVSKIREIFIDRSCDRGEFDLAAVKTSRLALTRVFKNTYYLDLAEISTHPRPEIRVPIGSWRPSLATGFPVLPDDKSLEKFLRLNFRSVEINFHSALENFYSH